VSALAASAAYATGNGTAVAPSDYQQKSGTVVVPAGQDDATVTVAVVRDSIDEPDETYAVTLSSPTNAVITDGSGTGTIADDDAPPTVNIGDVTRTEGDAGTVSAALAVGLSSASGRQITVDYACADGSATTPADYTDCSGTLTYAPGQTSKNVTVQVVGDTLLEVDESFFVVLSNEVNAGVADGSGRVTIADDDAADEPPSVGVASSQAVETAALATFDAAADDPDGDPLTVTWAFGDGSASAIGNPVGHRYDAPGTYDAEVSVSDGTSTTTENFTVTATDSGLVTRSSGDDRIATAVDASMDHWPAGSANDALLARADKFPDALAAGPLAAKLDAPLLLTSSDTLPASVEAELARLDVDRVWLLGGETSLTPALAQQLESLGYEVVRRAGPSRFDTAAAVATEVGRTADGEVVLALGSHPVGDHRAFPDALSAGSLSASPQRLPLVLTETADLPEATVKALAALQTKTVWIVGGESSVQPAVASRLEQLGYVAKRLSGDDRYLTSVAVAQEAMRRAPAGQVRLVLATGDKFPDGLAGGGIAARVDGILLLVPNGAAPDASSAFLDGAADRFDRGVVLGGPNTLSEAVRASMQDLIDR
jgi:putative cell wall-binding protein